MFASPQENKKGGQVGGGQNNFKFDGANAKKQTSNDIIA